MGKSRKSYFIIAVRDESNCKTEKTVAQTRYQCRNIRGKKTTTTTHFLLYIKFRLQKTTVGKPGFISSATYLATCFDELKVLFYLKTNSIQQRWSHLYTQQENKQLDFVTIILG